MTFMHQFMDLSFFIIMLSLCQNVMPFTYKIMKLRYFLLNYHVKLLVNYCDSVCSTWLWYSTLILKVLMRIAVKIPRWKNRCSTNVFITCWKFFLQAASMPQTIGNYREWTTYYRI